MALARLCMIGALTLAGVAAHAGTIVGEGWGGDNIGHATDQTASPVVPEPAGAAGTLSLVAGSAVGVGTATLAVPIFHVAGTLALQAGEDAADTRARGLIESVHTLHAARSPRFGYAIGGMTFDGLTRFSLAEAEQGDRDGVEIFIGVAVVATPNIAAIPLPQPVMLLGAALAALPLLRRGLRRRA